MSHQILFETLSARTKVLFDKLEKFLLNTDDYDSHNVLLGIVKVIKNDGETFEFKVGSRHFLIKSDIFLSKQMNCLRTYELVSCTDSFQNIRLNHLVNLDIVYIYNHHTRFVKKIVVTNGMLNEPTIIKEFTTQYVDKLWEVIQSLEEAEAPVLDELYKK